MDANVKNQKQLEQIKLWKSIVSKYEQPSRVRAIWQIINSFGLYFLLWYLGFRFMARSYWFALPFVFLAGGVLARIFIIFHDCGHGSFFRSRTANDIWGYISGVFVFTPYYNWRWEHSVHHATSGNLDRRGIGDIWTLTVDEFQKASAWKRFRYRLVRNPFILFLVAPIYFFFIDNRFPAYKQAQSREKRSVHWMNLGILALAVVISFTFGIKAYLLIELPTMAVAGTMGFWLFYIQHQFNAGYWERNEEWDFAAAAFQGSSFYKLPKVLQWLTGNIGFHHIHHLSSSIPNYYLERCHKELGLVANVKPLTFRAALKSIRYRLWDEEHQRFIGYSQLKKIVREDIQLM